MKILWFVLGLLIVISVSYLVLNRQPTPVVKPPAPSPVPAPTTVPVPSPVPPTGGACPTHGPCGFDPTPCGGMYGPCPGDPIKTALPA